MDNITKKDVISSGWPNFNTENPEERFLVGMFSQITERLKQKYNYSDKEIFRLWSSELLVPVAIFAGKLGPAEALAKFLKEKYLSV